MSEDSDPRPGESTEDWKLRQEVAGIARMRDAAHVVWHAIDEEPLGHLGFMAATRLQPEKMEMIARTAAESGTPIVFWGGVDAELIRHLHRQVPNVEIVTASLPDGMPTFWAWLGWQPGTARPNLRGLESEENGAKVSAICRHAYLHHHVLAAAGKPLVLRPTVIDEHWKKMRPGTLSTPPPERPWVLRYPDGRGFMPRGKAGMISAEGGAGKTLALLQLAVSVITGKPWLGYFEVDPGVVGRQVLMLLAEEDREEVHRRLYLIAESLALSADERRLVEERLVILPLAGEVCPLLDMDAAGSLHERPEVASLRRHLHEDKEGPGWALIGLDPLGRLSAADIDKNTVAGTRFVQLTESLTKVPGNPTVLTSHHSSKYARREGTVDARGTTALTDGVRWYASLRNDGSEVLFRQVKSNYSPPMPDELPLIRERGGFLRAARPEEVEVDAASDEKKRRDQVESDINAVVHALDEARSASSIDEVVLLAGIRLQRGRAAFRVALSRGWIVNVGPKRQPKYVVGTGGGGEHP